MRRWILGGLLLALTLAMPASTAQADPYHRWLRRERERREDYREWLQDQRQRDRRFSRRYWRDARPWGYYDRRFYRYPGYYRPNGFWLGGPRWGVNVWW